ncbi:MAG TPA: hypothetical protein VH590_15255, partial [Ktedonobacterales bacterium]
MQQRSGPWKAVRSQLQRVRPGVRRLRDASYLAKWLPMSALIGIVAGCGAIAFTLAISWATHFFLG